MSDTLSVENEAAEPVGDTTPFSIKGEYITLGQLLKAANAIGSGGEVRHFLHTTPVFLNGESENRRGRKIRPGDIVKVAEVMTIQVSARDPNAVVDVEDEE